MKKVTPKSNRSSKNPFKWFAGFMDRPAPQFIQSWVLKGLQKDTRKLAARYASLGWRDQASMLSDLARAIEEVELNSPNK